MFRHLAVGLVVVGLAGLAELTSGCGDYSPTQPVAPSQSLPAPAVTSVTPNVGSTGGGATMTITGTGIRSGATVTIDTTRATNASTGGPAGAFNVVTPAHAPGTVDLIVTNPDGQSHRLEAAYTYVSPASLDLNGRWTGTSYDGSDRVIAFIIENDKLVSASCSHEDTRALPIPSPPPSASNGEFSFVGSGASMSGRIVSPSEVIGTMNMAPCSNMTWKSYPRSPQDAAIR